MAVVLGLAAALSYSGADFLGGVLSRRTGVLPVVVLSQLASLVVLVAALAVTGFGVPTTEGLVWGGASGVIAGFGLIVYFRGLAVGRMALVAPTTAVVGAAVPVVAGLVLGERPGPGAFVGIGLAVVAVALVSLEPQRAVQPAGVLVAVDAQDDIVRGASHDDIVRGASHDDIVRGASHDDVRPERSSRPGLVEALAAGVAFGLFFVFLNQAGPGGEGVSGPLWPLLATTVASLGPIAAVVAVRRRSLRPGRGNLLPIALSGGLGSAGSLLFMLSAQRGLLSLAAVLASLSPAGTSLLARVFLHEQLGLPQLTGLVLAVAAATLIALG